MPPKLTAIHDAARRPMLHIPRMKPKSLLAAIALLMLRYVVPEVIEDMSSGIIFARMHVPMIRRNI